MRIYSINTTVDNFSIRLSNPLIDIIILFSSFYSFLFICLLPFWQKQTQHYEMNKLKLTHWHNFMIIPISMTQNSITMITYKLNWIPPMIEVEIFPRYMAHQLRAQLNASIVGKLIETNKKKASLMIETDPEGNHQYI